MPPRRVDAHRGLRLPRPERRHRRAWPGRLREGGNCAPAARSCWEASIMTSGRWYGFSRRRLTLTGVVLHDVELREHGQGQLRRLPRKLAGSLDGGLRAEKPATLASNSAITSSASSKPWRPSASMPSTPTFTEANTGSAAPTRRKPISAHFRSLGLENPFKKKPSRESPSKARAARAYWSRFSLSDALLDASSGRPHGP